MGTKKKKSSWVHLGLVLAVIICVSGFTVEYLRAQSGNTLSWAYVFEWPLFAGYAVYMWRKLLHEEIDGGARADDLPPRTSDPALDNYNDYLRSVHRHDADTPSVSSHGTD